MKIVTQTDFDIPQYPKTENLFARDPETGILITEFRKPEFYAVDQWRVTEKINGMNIRIAFLPDGDVFIGGKTDRAQLPGKLMVYLTTQIAPLMERISWLRGPLDDPEHDPECEPHPIILYGEGYGAGIQKGHGYNPEQRFCLFDVLYANQWLDWEQMQKVARILTVPLVPMLGVKSTERICSLFSSPFAPNTNNSYVALSENPSEPYDWEGIVAVAEPALFNQYGERVKFKLKLKDIKKSEAVREMLYA